MAVGVTNTFAQLGQLPGVGIAAECDARRWSRARVARHAARASSESSAAAPVALLAGGLVFLFITAIGRVGKPRIAISLGIIEQASDGAPCGSIRPPARRDVPARSRGRGRRSDQTLASAHAGRRGCTARSGSRATSPRSSRRGVERFRLGQPGLVLTLPQSSFARQVPPTLRPLADGHRSDHGVVARRRRIRTDPDAGSECNDTRDGDTDRSRLRQAEVPEPDVVCTRLTAILSSCVWLRGESLTFAQGPISVQLRRRGCSLRPRRLLARPAGHQRLEALVGPLDLRIGPVPGAVRRVLLCE